MEYTIKQKEFIVKATQQISDDPITRLSSITKDTLTRKNFVFDAHCHVFDGRCINVRYLAIRLLAGIPEGLKAIVWRIISGKNLSSEKEMLSVEELIEFVYNEPEVLPHANDIDAFLSHMESSANLVEVSLKNKSFQPKLWITQEAALSDASEIIERIRTIIALIRSNRMENVYKDFESKHAIHNVLIGPKVDLITIILGMDLSSGWEGKIPKTYDEQNTELAELADNYSVIPFLPIDPRRADDPEDTNLYEVFLKAFNKNNPRFFGVKCYPALGYLPSDSRLKPIFEICARKNIPILTHCGGEVISTFKKQISVDRDGVKEIITLSPRKARARFLNEPREWEPVLALHHGLRLCLAHFGGAKAWEEPAGVTGHRIKEILDLMIQHQVYTDFSFNIESQKATNNFIQKLFSSDAYGKIMRERSMFGTDFWVVLPSSDLDFDQRYFIKKVGASQNDLLQNNVIKFLGLEKL